VSVYFSSDFHFGHKVIVPKYRDFKSQEEHDTILLDNISKLNKRDILYVLGDFLFDSDKYDYYIMN
jgi:calcineurin-like phosphoesterase family protein